MKTRVWHWLPCPCCELDSDILNVYKVFWTCCNILNFSLLQQAAAMGDSLPLERDREREAYPGFPGGRYFAYLPWDNIHSSKTGLLSLRRTESPSYWMEEEDRGEKLGMTFWRQLGKALPGEGQGWKVRGVLGEGFLDIWLGWALDVLFKYF